MANVIRATITIRDNKNKRSRCGWYYPWPHSTWESVNGPGEAWISLRAYHNLLVQRLDALILGQIIDHSLIFQPALPAGLKAAPEVNSDVEEKARLIARDHTNIWARLTTDIPTYNHEYLEGGVTDPQGFYSLMLYAIETWTEEYGLICDARGVPIVNGGMPDVQKVFSS